jgi:lipopolysaccharide assembly protein A
MIVVYVLMALIGAAVAIFALQNLDPVVIRFLGWRKDGMPLAAVILISIVTGLVFSSLVASIRHLKLRRRIRHLEAQVHRMEAGTAPAPPALPSDPGLR